MFQDSPKMMRLWLMWQPYVAIYGPEEAEIILTSNKHINKSYIYEFLHPWMGLGLLTSYAEKWRPRRKLLTPTFHYDILKDFVDVFNQQAKVLVKLLELKSGQEAFNMYQYITLCALDIITQTAMGKCVNAQTNQQSDYVKAVYKLNDIIHERQKKPWFWNDFMFYKIGRGKEHDWCLSVLHGFTKHVIEERDAEIKAHGGFQQMFKQTAGGSKKRLAFLDLLLEMVDQGNLTLKDVQEETDTFMFEGHDTTSAGMNWTLHLLGLYPDIQEKVHQELDTIFGDDDDRDITFEDLKNLNYLEMCIKEALRLFPSVPMFGRTLLEDCEIKGKVIPAHTQLIIMPYVVHRDPEHWPDPEIYNPDRFLPENTSGRHPFAYLPFSAGSRNCIGQRFALMEEKTVLAWMLRFFKVKSVRRRDQIRPQAELILRPSEGIWLEMTLRRRPLSSSG
uniref:Cytochrome P450 n=1 Tax=Romanomermis culicivorax TaxID=13658 RepID=A0A915JWX6_ROMCU